MLDRIEGALRDFQSGTAVDDRAMLVLRFARRRPASRGRPDYPHRAMSSGSAPPPGGGGAAPHADASSWSPAAGAGRARRAAAEPAGRRASRWTRCCSAPLRLPLGRLQIGLVDRGAARASGPIGRFPVLRRLSATAVLPREEGIEGWLWTSTGGSALTVLGDEDEAPNGALLFTSPLGRDAARRRDAPRGAGRAGRALAAGRPGDPRRAVPLRRPGRAETAFRAYGLLRPLTDREVPPTMRRGAAHGQGARPVAIRGEGPSGSVAPPGF